MNAVALSDFRPDPKQPERIRDVGAIRRKMLRDRECRGCGGPASEGHHIVFKSHGGDDVEENIAPLCGGTRLEGGRIVAGCHARFHTDLSIDGKAIAAEIGRSLRPDEIGYVLRKMGDEPGWEYLRRTYGVEPPPRVPTEPVLVVDDAEIRLAIRRRVRAVRRSQRLQIVQIRRRGHGRPR